MNASMPIPRTRRRLSRREAWLIGASVVLLVAGLVAPDMTGPGAGSVTLSDVRTIVGLPNAMDVLTSLPSLLLGLLGLSGLHCLERSHEHGRHAPGQAHDELPGSALDCAWLFFAGLVLVAAGSAFYHLQPDDMLRLAGDRAAMAVALAAWFGRAGSAPAAQGAGGRPACVALAAGLLAVAVFHETGNVTPWAVVQFGGMALVLWMASMRAVSGGNRPMQLKLVWIIAAYALAKVLEMADGAVYELTLHLVSGHSLKHVVAALAALPVLAAVDGLAHEPLMHNPRAAVVTT